MRSQSTPLVVGVDGSAGSRDALALAARLADPGQRLLLTTSMTTARSRTCCAMGFQSANDALRAARDEQLTEALAAFGAGSDAGGRVVDGDAAVELIDASALPRAPS